MKPYIGQKLNNGAIVTSVHKQYPAASCTLWLLTAYWDSKPYAPYIVWEYNADMPGDVEDGSYCDSEEKQLTAFYSRKMNTPTAYREWLRHTVQF